VQFRHEVVTELKRGLTPLAPGAAVVVLRLASSTTVGVLTAFGVASSKGEAIVVQ
jgi:hypothetical protein